MPSVCKNSEKVSVTEAESALTPYKACISALDKKLRNLEKRKTKLDGYREKLDKGEKLDKDQKEAVAKYESVIANLEFARELQKLYQSMSDEADKLAEKISRKQAKKEKLERQQQDFDRLSDVLKLQSLMLSVGADEVRADLLAGKYGGLTLTEENLTQLDEFYQLISPTADEETSFSTQLTSATEHLVSYIDRNEKQVVGTTYREMHELVDRLINVGFLEASGNQEASASAAERPGHEGSGGDESNKSSQEEAAECELQQDEAASSVGSAVMVQAEPTEEGSYEAVPLPEVDTLAATGHVLPQSTAVETSSMTWYQSSAAKDDIVQSVGAMTVDNHSRYQRPLQDIVSSLQGSYNFLQESEIDDQSFERVNFLGPPDHSHAFVMQQMASQHGTTDLSQFGAAAGAGVVAQPNGGFVPAHHHQVAPQEPGFVMVSHDQPPCGIPYGYPGSQGGFLGPVMSVSSSADVTAQQSSGLVQSKCVVQAGGEPSVNRAGAGDAQDTMTHGVPVLPTEVTATGHQGFDPAGGHGGVYGGGRGGGRGGTVYAARGGSRAGNAPSAGGHMQPAGGRGGKSR